MNGLYWSFSEDVLGILHYVEGDLDAYVAELESIPSVLDYDIATASDEHFYVYHRCRRWWRPGTVRDLHPGNAPHGAPIEVSTDGSATFSLFGDDTEVQDALDDVPDVIRIDVHEVSGIAETPEVTGATLTARQRGAIEAGLRLGYYDIPREASYQDVAETMGCAPSTAAQHLQKAEGKLVQAAFQGYGR